MNAAIQRIFSALALLVIFGIALYLRLYGIDWAYKDGAPFSPHPDERHYESCANIMRPGWLTPEEDHLPIRQKLEILYQRNFGFDRNISPEDQTQLNRGLRPVNYNYGTFPLYLYMLYRSYLMSNSEGTGQWNLIGFDWLGLPVLLFVLVLGLLLYRRIIRDFRAGQGKSLPWYRDERPLMFFFPAMILPVIGLVLFAYLPLAVNNLNQYTPLNCSILLIGRLLTAWAGALTVLLTYLIGRDVYNRYAGLIAAAFLATAMLHVQTSHFATVDVLVGFWSTLAVYAFVKISRKPRLIWYLISAVAIGFAVSTKWSGVTLPGVLLVAHAAATWGNSGNSRVIRWIHLLWLTLAGIFTLLFFKAASSMDPLFNETLRSFYYTFFDYWEGAPLLWMRWIPYPRWWVALIVLLCFISSLVLLKFRSRWHGDQTGWLYPAWQVYRPWLWLLVSIPVGLLAFFLTEPMAYFDAQWFAHFVVNQARIIVTGEYPIVYTMQFNNTPGIFYYLDNLFYPSLDYVTAFFVIVGTLYALTRVFRQATAGEVVLLIWVVPSLLVYGTFQAKFPRYIVTILPVLMVFGGRLLSDLILINPYFFTPYWSTASLTTKRIARGVGIAGCALAIICGTIYGFAYMEVYRDTHTLVTAGNVLRQIAPSGSNITQNNWDEGPIGVHIEYARQMQIHTGMENEQNDPLGRARYFAEQLQQNDFIVLPSKRSYGTSFQNPNLYPVTNQFLRALFAEQLGFRVAKVITNPPKFLWWEFRVDEEDETARIYDHPKVIIFEKVQKFEVEDLVQAIINPPAWVHEVTSREILSLQDGYPVFHQPPSHPVLRWWLIVQALGWITFLLIFSFCKPLADRGYGVSKAIGLALFAWISWMLASIHLFPLSRIQTTIIFLFLLFLAGYVGAKIWKHLRVFLREHWKLILGLELVYLSLWFIFLIIRIYHPAITFGEKPMNISFLTSVYRTSWFPPEDPWIADFWINYYYYGHAIFAIVGRFIDLPPSYLFNIAGPCVTALVGVGIFSLVYNLCQRVFISLLATYLCVFAGHIFTYINLIKQVTGLGDVTFEHAWNGLRAVLKLMGYTLLTYLGFADDAIRAQVQQLNYDLVFWASSRTIPNTVANEFPYWMHLFLDFHAHMLVLPFVIAWLVLLYAWFARPQRETTPVELTASFFFLALLLGTITITNTWDLPAALIVLLLVSVLKFWRESELALQGRRGGWLTSQGVQSFMTLPVAPILTVSLLSVIMTYPFHNRFISRVSSVKIMPEGQTHILTYLGFWGHLLLPVLIGILLFALVRRNGRISLKRIIAATLSFAALLAFAYWANRANPFNFTFSLNPERMPLDYRTPAIFLPFLMMLFLVLWQRWRDTRFIFACLLGVLGLGLSVGIELFYVQEPGWGPPGHRWNTVFKFNLQVWHYLSIFAALSLFYVWQILPQMGAHIGRWFAPLKRTVFIITTFSIFFLTLPFAVIAPALVTLSHGSYRDAHGIVPSLDGFAWLRQDHYSDYAAIQWLNRFVEGTPNIVEMSMLAGGYNNEQARFSSSTGLPTLLGWHHHVGERIHFVPARDRRLQAVRTIYESRNKQEVINTLGRHKVEYLLFGKPEMYTRREQGKLPPYGKPVLQRFERWGDVFNLLYRYGDTSIFKINSSLNPVYQLSSQAEPAQPELPPALRPPDEGVSMYNTTTPQGYALFSEPRGITTDQAGNFYVADSFNHRIQVFKPDGSHAWRVGEKGAAEGEFNEPNDVAIDPNTGNLYVLDTWNHRVVLLSPQGETLGMSGQLSFGPRAIAFHPQYRMLYISVTGGHHVMMMSPEGDFIRQFGSLTGDANGLKFNEPIGIDVTPDGNIIVVDAMNRRLKKLKFDDGALLQEWEIQTQGDPAAHLEAHVACAPDGNIYLTDHLESCVHEYSAAGELLNKIRTDLSGNYMVTPLGIAVSPSGQIVITDKNLNRVMRIR
jgi:YYY domain-containing protein